MRGFALALAFFLLCGCATPDRMNRLSIGMTKAEVIDQLGSPDSSAGQGNAEVLKYQLGNDHPLTHRGWETYFVRLVSGKVESYGKMGDFDSATINLNVHSN